MTRTINEILNDWDLGGYISGGFGAQDDLTITDTTVGTVETIVITNGTLTKTVTIDDSTGGITIIWS